MKKIAKLQYETKVKLDEILSNASDIYCSNWSIADEPKELPQEQRIFKYYSEAEKVSDRLFLTKELFGIKKVKDLYCVGNLQYLEALNKAKEEHAKHLKNISEKEMPE